MGQLYSTLNDLAKFASFELDAWPPRDTPDEGPIRRSTLRESQMAFGSSNGSTGFGVNWIVMDDKDVGHVVFYSGTTGDYAATIWMLPRRRIAVVALAGNGNYGALDELARGALGMVASTVPEPVPELGEAVSAALVRVLELMKKADVDGIKAAFSPKFLANIAPEKVVETFEKVSKALGSCKEHHTLRVAGPTSALVQLTCEKGAVNFQIDTAPEPPYLLEGLQLEPAKEQ
jgi:hypothetical protein